MNKIKIKDYIDKRQTSQRQNVLAVCVLWVLYGLGGKGHISDVTQLVKDNMVDFEDAENYLAKTVSGKKDGKENLQIDNDIAFARNRLRILGIIKKPIKYDGIWELEDSITIEKYIRGLSNLDTEEETKNELFEDLQQAVEKDNKKNRDTKKNTQKNTYSAPQEQDSNDDIKQDQDFINAENELLEKIVGKYTDKPFEFEFLCVELVNKIDADILEKKWIKTQDTRDGGVDGVGYYNVGILKFKAILQVKIQDQNVTRQKIVEFLGTIQDHNADKGVFITTSDFTKDARELAEKHNITIINGRQLARYMMNYWSDKVVEIMSARSIDNSHKEDSDNHPRVSSVKSPRRPSFKFSMVDIPIGAELTFTENEIIKVRVVNNKEVKLDNGAPMSLTQAAKKFLNKDKDIQGPLYFKYKGETLVERRKRMEQEGTLKK